MLSSSLALQTCTFRTFSKVLMVAARVYLQGFGVAVPGFGMVGKQVWVDPPHHTPQEPLLLCIETHVPAFPIAHGRLSCSKPRCVASSDSDFVQRDLSRPKPAK